MSKLNVGDLVIYAECNWYHGNTYYKAEVIRVTKTLAICKFNGSDREERVKREQYQDYGELQYETYPSSSSGAYPYCDKWIEVYNMQQSLLKVRNKSAEVYSLVKQSSFLKIDRNIMDSISHKLNNISSIIGRQLEVKEKQS